MQIVFESIILTFKAEFCKIIHIGKYRKKWYRRCKMFMNYFFYLKDLTEIERNKQILIFILFWVIMFTVAGLLQLIFRTKENDKSNIKQ